MWSNTLSSLQYFNTVTSKYRYFAGIATNNKIAKEENKNTEIQYKIYIYHIKSVNMSVIKVQFNKCT